MSEEDNDEQNVQQMLKQSAIASIHRDKSLSSVEKQQRIQAILRGKDYEEKKPDVVADADAATLTHPNIVSHYSGKDAVAITSLSSTSANDARLFGCAHFKRDLYLLAPCCNKWYVCRICHDDQENHSMDQQNIKKQCCMHCLEVTDVGANCTSEKCRGRQLAHYYCDKCHIHRKETDLLFWHCEKCGMCRAGSQKMQYIHCDRCNLCYPVEAGTSHKCLQSPSETQSCPICSQSIQTSQKPVVAMRCGHGIHFECYRSLLTQRDLRSMRCPLCKLSFDNMDHIWADMDFAIATTVMPEPERYWTVHIGCNDCQTHTENAPFHYYGFKCSNAECGSYNTFVVEMHKVDADGRQIGDNSE